MLLPGSFVFQVGTLSTDLVIGPPYFDSPPYLSSTRLVIFVGAVLLMLLMLLHRC